MRGFTVASVITLVIVVVVVAVAAILLGRTVQEAQSINNKAQNIAKNGRGINTSTDSVIQLTRTNKLATSILGSARPLDSQLGGIVATAQGIDGLAGSINSTAGTINTTAGSLNISAGRINPSSDGINSAAGAINTSASSINGSALSINGSVDSINAAAGRINVDAGRINATAGSINTSARRIDRTAGSILGTARQIDTDVRLINQNLDVTLRLVTAVKGDTGNILDQARGANDTAACIDFKVIGSAGNTGCGGRLNASSRQGRSSTTSSTPSLKGREQLKELLDKGLKQAPANPAPKAAPQSAPQAAPRQRNPLPELPELPELPTQADDVLDGLLPGLGDRSQDRSDGQPGIELPELDLERLLRELGQR